MHSGCHDHGFFANGNVGMKKYFFPSVYIEAAIVALTFLYLMRIFDFLFKKIFS